ncbi:MAG: ATP/GTP-binding protein [Methanomassiliicoccales archaeon]|uniref:PRK13768 family protein n=1 Tax=Candidatus Methanarcanum hacksteinii TaxID=2911857 RepID=UPI0015AC1428|nr:ATP/GTP-binding protein [Candidatus Methanomethylophilaceae archaeon]MCI6025186.1 ATP/GTP-binding protein [Methanomassiliicoccales archaeon]MDD7479549.1 ATP/GTP-binding protein [Methanomassiliicoccales archaeon]MDO5837158.1 ATP/GTP-binding protein [Methanomassiliicoccales archaeon]MDY4580470.1 ATP/GTP-binding protein [Candidatus Methanarcanum hacksteinii]
MRFVYFVGTAGSGKSTLVKSYRDWLGNNGIDCMTINLDPGVDMLPYDADIDIREWVALDEVMGEYNLGPNGAQIVAADLMAVNIKKITDLLDGVRTEYVLVDTPGQLELFAFRESSNVIVEAFGKEKSMVVYLSDPMLCKTSNGFVSNMVLSSLVEFRLQLPVINILTKADLMKDEDRDRMISWFENSDSLYDDLLDNDANPQTVVGMELFKAVESVGIFGQIRAVSAVENTGLEEIYSATQLEFFGGEDIDPEDND